MSGNANNNVGRVFNMTSGSGDMAASVYDPTGKREDVFAYAQRMVDNALSQLYSDFANDNAIYQTVLDSSENTFQDSTGEAIQGRIRFAIK